MIVSLLAKQRKNGHKFVKDYRPNDGELKPFSENLRQGNSKTRLSDVMKETEDKFLLLKIADEDHVTFKPYKLLIGHSNISHGENAALAKGTLNHIK